MELIPLTELSEPVRERLLALNNAHAAETSWLDRSQWDRLTGGATLALAVPEAAGFVVAFDQGAAYDSPNFLWLRNRFERFLYVDRVVVAKAHRGRGIARALYGAVIAAAAGAGLGRVVAEVNRHPPNPVSDAFHEALGFRPLATRDLSPEKSVRYLERPVDSA